MVVVRPPLYIVGRDQVWRRYGRADKGTPVPFGAAFDLTQLGGSSTGGSSTPSYTRPSGAGYVRYEDLYVTGDDLSTTIGRVPAGKVITFPEGIFEFTDLNAPSGAANYGIFGSHSWGGMVGSGPCDLTMSSGTIFRLKKNSLTKAQPAQDNKTANTLAMFYQGAATAGQSSMQFGQFSFVGTDQSGSPVGKEQSFNGMVFFKPTVPLYLFDISVFGWYGNNGSPPGETFGISTYYMVGGNAQRVLCDGRRGVGSMNYGAVGATLGQLANTSQFQYLNSTFHHNQFSQFVVYSSDSLQMQTKGGITIDCVFGDPNGPGTYYTKSIEGLSIHPISINHEMSDNTTHTRPALWGPWNTGDDNYHISHNANPTTHSSSLTIIDPTWINISNQPSRGQYGNVPWFETWPNPYGYNNSNPVVTSGGVALPYGYSNGTKGIYLVS